MPMYEYLCAGCGNEFERLVTIANADSRQECPKCGKDQGKRLMSAPAVSSSTPASRIPAPSAGCGSSGFG